MKKCYILIYDPFEEKDNQMCHDVMEYVSFSKIIRGTQDLHQN